MSTNDCRDSTSVHSVKISITHRKPGEFVARKSLLTDLFQISHINCIRNAFIAGFILMISHQIVNDLVHYGRLNWTFDLLLSTTGKLHIVFIVWFLMILSTIFIVFYGTSIWASYRNFNGFFLKLYDAIWLWIYVCYLTGLLVIPCWQIVEHQLPFVSSAIIVGEQLRLLMKTHSFIRENVGKIIQQSNNSNDQQLSIEFSQFNQYLYFLFAPTLVYRDNYPRTSTIQWSVVFQMFGQFIIILCLGYHVISNFWMPVFRRFFTNDEIPLEVTVSSIFDLMLPGAIIIVLAFYSFFHCWLNGFAELLRFADRMFYEDWWNATAAATFWRSWNIVVHDWLHVYVYKDMIKFFNVNRTLSAICVVIVSAIFHEYFMIVTFQLFSVILIIWFGVVGMLLRFVVPPSKSVIWNIVLLTCLPMSAAFVTYLYVLEFQLNIFLRNVKHFGT